MLHKPKLSLSDYKRCMQLNTVTSASQFLSAPIISPQVRGHGLRVLKEPIYIANSGL